jgi:hypothetical protein
VRADDNAAANDETPVVPPVSAPKQRSISSATNSRKPWLASFTAGAPQVAHSPARGAAGRALVRGASFDAARGFHFPAIAVIAEAEVETSETEAPLAADDDEAAAGDDNNWCNNAGGDGAEGAGGAAIEAPLSGRLPAGSLLGGLAVRRNTINASRGALFKDLVSLARPDPTTIAPFDIRGPGLGQLQSYPIALSPMPSLDLECLGPCQQPIPSCPVPQRTSTNSTRAYVVPDAPNTYTPLGPFRGIGGIGSTDSAGSAGSGSFGGSARLSSSSSSSSAGSASESPRGASPGVSLRSLARAVSASSTAGSVASEQAPELAPFGQRLARFNSVPAPTPAATTGSSPAPRRPLRATGSHPGAPADASARGGALFLQTPQQTRRMRCRVTHHSAAGC